MVDLVAYERLQQQAETKGALLVAVSKTKPVADIQQLYDAGHRDFGENYVQELVDKQQELPQDINWHYIGHLQRNKVKEIVSFVHLIHGVDSVRLLQEINKRAQKIGRIVDVLFQVHIAEESTKFGFAAQELLELLEQPTVHRMAWIRPSGLMGMATFTKDTQQIEREYDSLQQLFETIQQRFYDRRPEWSTLSMGMSADYALALQQGSTLLRIGSTLFGARG